MKNRLIITVMTGPALIVLFCFIGCATTSSKTAGVSGPDDVTVKRLIRENEELKTKVDDLLSRVLKLSRLLDDHQVKLDYLADKVRTLDNLSAQDDGPSGAVQSGIQLPKQTSRSAATTESLAKPERNETNPDLMYDEAHADYRAGAFQEAIIKFKEFVLLFPKNNRVSNAQYWIGESYYSLQEYQNALQAFQLVLQNYPLSGKIPDAMVKKGLCYSNLGKKELAAVEFQQVIDQFPSSNAADIARQKLGL